MTNQHLVDRRTFIGSLIAAPAVLGLLSACGVVGAAELDEIDADGVVASDKTRAAGSDPALAAAKINRLGASMLTSLGAASPSGNLILSPLSVATTLAMAVNGAADMTEYEMGIVLGANAAITVEDGDPVSNYLKDLQPSMNALLTSLGERSRFDAGDSENVARTVRLDLANALWAQSGFSWKRGFLDALAQNYGTGIHTADFKTRPEDARVEINRWVADATQDKIPDLLASEDITELSRLILINAVYLAADWKTRFGEWSTSDADFSTAAGDVVPVPMMHLHEDLRAAEGDGWVAVELPYAFDELSMVVAIPDRDPADGDRELPALDEIVEQLDTRDVDLQLPKFEIDQNVSLKEILGQLGMERAFTVDADFSRMTDDEPLLIGDVIHQAKISIDENGTEAAAATEVEMMAGSPAPGEDDEGPLEIVADRPFTFWLRDTVTGVAIFTGRVNNPLQK